MTRENLNHAVAAIQRFCDCNNSFVSFAPKKTIKAGPQHDIQDYQYETFAVRVGDYLPVEAAFVVTLDTPGYYKLAEVLGRAFDQAAKGKGRERHANELPFHEQPMQRLADAHGIGFLTGQACKKAEEALGLKPGADVAELLGAINYLAGAVIHLEANRKAAQANDNTMKPERRHA